MIIMFSNLEFYLEIHLLCIVIYITGLPIIYYIYVSLFATISELLV